MERGKISALRRSIEMLLNFFETAARTFANIKRYKASLNGDGTSRLLSSSVLQNNNEKFPKIALNELR